MVVECKHLLITDVNCVILTDRSKLWIPQETRERYYLNPSENVRLMTGRRLRCSRLSMGTRSPWRDYKGSGGVETVLDFVFFRLLADAMTFLYIAAHIGYVRVFISYGNRIWFMKSKIHILYLRSSSIYYMIFSFSLQIFKSFSSFY